MRNLVAHSLRCALVGLPTVAQASVSHPSTAASPAATRVTAREDSVGEQRFDIPAQPLPSALRAFSRQAGVEVLYDTAGAAGRRSSAVDGTFSAADALRRLLEGSGYAGRFVDARTVMLRRSTGRETVRELGPVVVTGVGTRRSGYAASRSSSAMKTNTPLRDTPQSVTVLTRELIADQAMQGMADVVRYVPGVTMGQGEGHRDAPTIRGNSSTADFFVDGVRDDAQYLRDLYNVDRVEALKGSNAMIFGRGGGGGVLNRVTKDAQWAPTRALVMEGGSYDHKRGTLDVGQGFGTVGAARLNGMYENSEGFRERARLERYGINPTVAISAGERTAVRLGYEYFSDSRNVDRGIPSFEGRPVRTPIARYFGNPDVSFSAAEVSSGTALVEHSTPLGLTVRNRTRLAAYDKFYQNSFPGAINAAGTQVSLSGYNNGIARHNLFNQTDVTYGLATGAVRHTLLVGTEFGRQSTSQYRATGYYNNTATSFAAPLDAPTVTTPVTFRQSATDADAFATTRVAAVYAQNQIALSPRWEAVLGLRYERFGIDYRNRRTDQTLARDDRLLSPRAGLVFKPAEPVSLYGGYSVSYLPGSGDQFSALTVTTQTLKPEQFTNYEVGAKWDARPDLSLTTAVFRLDRENTSAPDPLDPTRVVQTGSARTTGYEVGVTGTPTSRWQVAGGFAAQKATITSTTAAAKAGATVPLVPSRTVSLWNKYQVVPALGLGLGVVHQADMYAAIDNSVTLPSFTRLDGGLFVRVNRYVRAQLNVENLLDREYYPTSQGNNNIMPGAPRTVRLSLATGL